MCGGRLQSAGMVTGKILAAEENGKVSKERLEQWLLQFRKLLERNDQSRLFGAVVGRLFLFSPPGEEESFGESKEWLTDICGCLC